MSAASRNNPKVDAFMARAEAWRPEFERLRAIILASGLDEELKWGQPCYALDGGNVVLIHGFKDYCAVLFMKGALLKDPEGVLIQQTPNVQSARHLRFTSLDEVERMAPIIARYVDEAIAVEKAGLKVQRKTTADFEVVEEFLVRLESEPGLQDAFDALTPGRQRSWLFWLAQPKQSKTREARVEKAIPLIRQGKGLND